MNVCAGGAGGGNLLSFILLPASHVTGSCLRDFLKGGVGGRNVRNGSLLLRFFCYLPTGGTSGCLKEASVDYVGEGRIWQMFPVSTVYSHGCSQKKKRGLKKKTTVSFGSFCVCEVSL